MSNHIDPASVLALAPMAGRGTRLGLKGSKELVSLAQDDSAERGRLCEVMLQRMCDAGLREAALTLAPDKQDIRDYLGDCFRARDGATLALHYSTVVDSPNTLVSIDAAFDQTRGRVCALGFADILYQPCAGYARAIDQLSRSRADVVLGLFPTSQPTTSDMVAFDADGSVRKILIKQAAGARYAYTWSLAVWRPAFSQFMHEWLQTNQQGFDALAAAQPAELFVGDAVIAAQAAGLAVSAVVVSTLPSLDAGTPESLRRARSLDWGLGALAR